MDSKQNMHYLHCKVGASIPKQLVNNMATQYIKNGWTLKQFQINLGLTFNQAKYAFMKARKELES